MCVFLSSCNDFAERETFQIPDKYIGRIVIAFNQFKGEPIKYIDDRRIYMISKNGILATQFPVNDGWHSLKKSDQIFEYVDSNGRPKRRLPVHYNDLSLDPTDTSVQIFEINIASFGSTKLISFNVDRYINYKKYTYNSAYAEYKFLDTTLKKIGIDSMGNVSKGSVPKYHLKGK